MDYNVDHYDIPSLLVIVGLQDTEEEPPGDWTADEIKEATRPFIARFRREQNVDLQRFFEEVETKLLQFYSTPVDRRQLYTPNNQQVNNWYTNQALPQTNNSVQKDKVTDRKQQIEVFDNQHVPMNRNQLGVANQVEVPVAQDTLNPNLENTIRQIVCIDSQFRQASGGSDNMSTHFTLDLSDKLYNVLSLELYSISIPYTWYAIDTAYGNTCFWVYNLQKSYLVSIQPGNYLPAEFCTALQSAVLSAGFAPPSADPGAQFATYTSTNGKIVLRLSGWTDPSGNVVEGVGATVTGNETDQGDIPMYVFFDITTSSNCSVQTADCNNAGQARTFSGTLGWIMGFRELSQPVYANGNYPEAVLTLSGPKYLILVIDDYNQNHVNNGLITITELSKKLPLPSYYNASMPYFCTAPSEANAPAISTLTLGSASGTGGVGGSISFNQLLDKVDMTMKQVQQILPSAPRTLTKSQIYTINEINKNRSQTTSFRAKAPTNSDTFAIIPVKVGMKIGDVYSEFSSSLKENKRIYFGPVNIERLRIHLLDDHGNTLDLHGADWCVVLISTNLYQY